MVESVGESERKSERSAETGGSLAKMGGQVALASTVSRITGFVRTLALAAVLGIALVSDAYNAANSFPNMVYQLLLGGILASVLLPYLTRQPEPWADARTRADAARSHRRSAGSCARDGSGRGVRAASGLGRDR
ncbi:MAG: lipid II flippase MurJ [Rhodococcus qingshengii]